MLKIDSNLEYHEHSKIDTYSIKKYPFEKYQMCHQLTPD